MRWCPPTDSATANSRTNGRLLRRGPHRRDPRRARSLASATPSPICSARTTQCAGSARSAICENRCVNRLVRGPPTCKPIHTAIRRSRNPRCTEITCPCLCAQKVRLERAARHEAEHALRALGGDDATTPRDAEPDAASASPVQ
eukprot:2643250-Prymnesium_polylepis.1